MQMVSRHMKRCSVSLSIREMQIKTTARNHLIAVRIAVIKKNPNNKCWQGCGEKGTLLHTWWGYKLVQPIWKTIWRFLKKLKIELWYDPVVQSWVYIWKKQKLIRKDTCNSVFIATLFIIAKICKWPQCPSGDEWIKKMWMNTESEVAQSCPTLCDPLDCSLPGSSVHGIFQARILEWVAISFSRGGWILLNHKKEWNLAIWNNMDGLGGYYAKWNKSDRKINVVWHHLYVESKK